MKKRLWFYIFLLLLPLFAGIIYFDILHMTIPKTKILYDDTGKVIDSVPIDPNPKIWFGTDYGGDHLFIKSLAGYRFTILCIVGVAILTMLISTVIASYLAFRKGAFDFVTDVYMKSFYFIPQAVFAYILLSPVMQPMDPNQAYPLVFRVIYNMIVLAFVLLPTTVVVLRDEIRQALNHEYIEASNTLGAGKMRQLIKHVWPNLKKRYLIIFMRNIYQTLLVMVHLAFLRIMFGGTDICAGEECFKQSAFHELTTMIGMNVRFLYSSWWVFMVPLVFIVYILIIAQLIADTLESEEVNS